MQKSANSELIVNHRANSVHLVGNAVVPAHAVVCKGLYLVAAVGYGSYLAEYSKEKERLAFANRSLVFAQFCLGFLCVLFLTL